MPAHFAVFKKPNMILLFKTDQLADAHDLAVILPSNKMITETLRFQKFQERFRIATRCKFPKHIILPALMM